MSEYFHSVTLDKPSCKGCTTCIKLCPTQAIRAVSYTHLVTYMLIYIVTQLLFPLVNLITGGLLTSHFAASLIIVGILTPLLTQFFTYFVFQRLLPDNREWTDGAG